MTKRYDTYKDSGVQWLGEIPGHWDSCIIKRVLEGIQDGTHSTIARCESEYPLLSAKNLTEQGITISENESCISLEDHKKIVANGYPRKGDVALCGVGATLGKCTVYEFEKPYSFQRSVTFLRPNEHITSHFLSYIIKSSHTQLQFSQYKKKSAIEGIYAGDIQRLLITLPPLSEQQSIVTYLNEKCSKIDEWVAQKQKEVELLSEMKQRVIADAVTRGLNPNVKMKASNIPWLPEVPEHWEIKPIRSLLKESDEKSETGKEELLSLSQYTGITYKKDASKTGMFEAESTVGYKKVHPGQFVMNIMLAWNGSYAVSELEGIISPAYCVFDFICECDKMYYDYLLRTKMYASAFKTESRGIIESRLRLYPNKFYPFHIPVPPIEEQRAIVAHITDKTSKIDKLITNINKEIEALKEYKQRLISDVVTGQIKVC